jgi:Raf kinase inhibitor-like YbhB/YbcL family protein
VNGLPATKEEDVMEDTSFTAGSVDLQPGAPIPDEFAYAVPGGPGRNVSPSVHWRNPPAGTLSFAVLVHDPDAPTGGAGFWHWLIIDIPANVTSLAKGAGEPQGTLLPSACRQLTNDYGEVGWGGPCPPVGDPPHRYNFTVYALKVAKLDLPANATASAAGFLINANALAKASFMGTYQR